MKRIFIGGCPRSGTTLVQSIVTAHPTIAPVKETRFFERGNATEQVNQFLRKLDAYAAKYAAEAWCEKSPGHILRIRRIQAYSPGAKFIFIHRLKDDVVPCLHRLMVERLGNDPRDWTLEVCQKTWENYDRVFRSYQASGKCYCLRFEDLIDNQSNEIAKLSEFIGFDLLPWQHLRPEAAKKLIRRCAKHHSKLTLPIAHHPF